MKKTLYTSTNDNHRTTVCAIDVSILLVHTPSLQRTKPCIPWWMINGTVIEPEVPIGNVEIIR